MKLTVILHGVPKMSTEYVSCFPSEIQVRSMERFGYEFQIDGKTVSAQTVINIGNGLGESETAQEPAQKKAGKQAACEQVETVPSEPQPVEKKTRTKKKSAAEENADFGIKPLF